MQNFVVIRSGIYSSTVNGKEETAPRTAVVGVYSSQEKAEAALKSGGKSDDNWAGWYASWIDTAEVDADPIWG